MSDNQEKVFKRDVYTKTLLLALEPTQWKKLKFICKQNKKTINEQLRLIIDRTISIYEQHKGEIVVEEDDPTPKQ